MLEQITPVILTYNEAPNIGRTMEQLRWAREIVVVDSHSEDNTVDIVGQFPQARLCLRKFDTHHQQWNYALHETGIASPWVMALDADFVLSTALIDQIRELKPERQIGGYRAPFVFCIQGRKLRSAICPPSTFLFRRDQAEYFQDGHTQKLSLDGTVESLPAPIYHDDRKPLSRWLASQKQYARLEAAKLASAATGSLDFADRIRRLRIVAPWAMGFYCLFARGGILDGRAGIYYSAQRATAELMLSWALLERDLGFAQPRAGERVTHKELAAQAKLADVESGK